MEPSLVLKKHEEIQIKFTLYDWSQGQEGDFIH